MSEIYNQRPSFDPPRTNPERPSDQGPGNRPGQGPGNRPGQGSGNQPGQGPGNRPGPGPVNPPRPIPPRPMPPRPREEVWVTDAIINSIRRSRGTTFVSIVFRQEYGPQRGRMQIVELIVNEQTRIQDENRNRLRPGALEVGMIISALFSANMTRSNPPQAQAFQIIVQEWLQRNQITEGRIVQVDQVNRFIVTMTGNQPNTMIRFNLNPETVIFGIAGQRITLGNLFPGLRVRIEHADFMTASIPPQTTAFVIQVIR